MQPFLLKVWLSVFLLLVSLNAFGQAKTDTSNKVTINIIFAKSFIGVKSDSGTVTKLIDSVSLEQGGTLMYCDSTYINMETNNLEAFGNVRILQPGGTQVTSDYLKYIGNKKLAYLRGNVKLTDGKNNLWSEDLTYDLGTKVGVYENGGTLQTDATTVSSNKGMYNVKTKDSRFTEEVFITDPQYTTSSEDLGYNTETKFVTFFAPSTVTNANSELKTSEGTYDSKNDIAHFTKRSSIFNKEHYIEADKIDYNGATRLGNALGKVIVIDTTRHSTMWCGFAAYNEKKRTMFSTLKPVLLQANGPDSLYIRADTFFSSPLPKLVKKTTRDTVIKKVKDSLGRWVIPKAEKTAHDSLALTAHDTAAKKALVNTPDSLTKKPEPPADTLVKQQIAADKPEKETKSDTVATKPKGGAINLQVESPPAEKTKKGRKNKVVKDSLINNEPDADSTAPRYYIGYHHVLIYSDSLQGKCDSISYNQRDSVMKMMRDPIVWSRKSQITGDTILLFNDSSKIKRMFVPNNALIVSQSGPDKAKLFDQVQGKTLTAHFKKNKIDNMVVFPDAESIYYPKDDNGAYLGVNQGKSERMRIFFHDQGIQTIKLEQDLESTITPMDKVNHSTLRLSRFKWLPELRPQSKEELFK